MHFFVMFSLLFVALAGYNTKTDEVPFLMESESMADWQKCFIDYMENITEVDANDGYYLIYINDDDIPEIVEMGCCEAAGNRIVYYNGREAQVVQLGRLNFTYIERENLLCNGDGNTDYYWDDVYSIIDGKITLIANGRYGELNERKLVYDENGDVYKIYDYEWNGKSVSEEEYKRFLGEVYDKNKAKTVHLDNLYSKDTLIQVIKKW